ncbi:NfeD family protein [Brevundimonas faecalis]|uniref:Membrane protein implicated in regulation of membrane protease activity n=1 Tax=Brevundimonas faecalis TaxID=947378 RepID=A0ABV2RAH1_9CAUL
MEGVMNLYAAQPFWLWLAIGVVLLAIEAMASTEWLLWPAVSAGLVALISALLPGTGFPIQVGIFAALTVVSIILSRRLIKRVNPDQQPDINARDVRLVGQKAKVVEAFINGRGRVFVSGAEWPAEIEGSAPLAGETVVVESVDGALLHVRTA